MGMNEFFEKCMIVVRVPDVRPAGIDRNHPPESDLLWYNTTISVDSRGLVRSIGR